MAATARLRRRRSERRMRGLLWVAGFGPAERRYKNIVYWNELEKGGHFAAFEQPEIFVEEVRAAFRAIRSSTV